MRVDFASFKVDVQAETSEGEHPHVYTFFKVIYHFEGQGIDPAKLMKMVLLSQERYCGVAAMLRQAAPLAYEVYLNGVRIDN